MVGQHSWWSNFEENIASDSDLGKEKFSQSRDGQNENVKIHSNTDSELDSN